MHSGKFKLCELRLKARHTSSATSMRSAAGCCNLLQRSTRSLLQGGTHRKWMMSSAVKPSRASRPAAADRTVHSISNRCSRGSQKHVKTTHKHVTAHMALAHPVRCKANSAGPQGVAQLARQR
jgi:hypothetical protein